MEDVLNKRWHYSLKILLIFGCLSILLFMTYLPNPNEKVRRNLEYVQPKPVQPIESFTAKAYSRSMINDDSSKHPCLVQECFVYGNLSAKFTCNKTSTYKKYNNELIKNCITKAWQTLRDKGSSAVEGISKALKGSTDPWDSAIGNSPSHKVDRDSQALDERPSVRLLMIGDSHIRNIYDLVTKRIASPRVKYRLSSFKKGDWRDAPQLFLNRRETMHDFTHITVHLDWPLVITYHYDPFLEHLPQMLQSWISGNTTLPSHLLLGSSLHYMRVSTNVYLKDGPVKASEPFLNQIKLLSPLLQQFAKLRSIIFKLEDHLQKSPKNNIANQENIDLYNQIVRDNIPETANLSIWNSTLPLSDLYAEECRRSFKKTPETDMWKCHDKKHVGYIMIEQYVDMFLNDFCDKF